MAFTFDTTTSGTSTNSYVTVEELDDYIDSFLFIKLSLSAEQKQKLLVMAFRILQSLVFAGIKSVQTQAAEWPRVGMIDKQGISISQSTIPQALKDAQVELALYLFENNVRFFGEGNDERVVNNYTAGSLTFNYRELANPDQLPLRVQQLLKDIGPGIWQHKRLPVQFRM